MLNSRYIIICVVSIAASLLNLVTADRTDQPITTISKQLETCKPMNGAINLGKQLVPPFLPAVQRDITFFPVLTQWKSNFDEIRMIANARKIHLDNKNILHDETNTMAHFKTGRIFGIGM